MTRIIVRNLPDKITKERLHDLFSEKGVVTDVQLKFTKSGKFRKFAFVGFQKEEHAEAAINSFNKTYINTSRIEIEQCKGLADPEKPRSWSKHAADSSAYQKKRTDNEDPNEGETKKMKKNEQKKIKDPKLENLLQEYKNDVMFKEFVETQMPDDKTLLEMTETAEEKVVEEDKTKLADKSISDLEYLKLKTGQEQLNLGKDKEVKEETKSNVKQPRNIKLYTVKIKGLPIQMKKSGIKDFLGVKPFTIRRACGQRGIVFAGFKDESRMKKALFKNRSFFSGKRIFVREVKSAEDLAEAEKNEKWQEQENKIKNEESIAESGKIFIRNLPYVVNEDDIKPLFEKYGPIADIILPIDSFTRKPKGFCIITFVMPEHAAKAFSELDGTIFQGRMLHLLPGIDNAKKEEDEENAEDSNYKLKKQKKDKKNAGCTKNWNTFFVSENVLAAAMAEEYNTSKENVLSDSGNAAVRLALGETQIINKMKEFLEENGVCLDSFTINSNCSRSNRIILVKNLPFGTKVDEIREKFAEFGELQRVVLPPHGITGIVEFIEPSEAKKAFRKLAYTKFKSVPLYLEWAPEKVFKSEFVPKKDEDNQNEVKVDDKSTTEQPEDDANDKVPFGADYISLESSQLEGTTIFVKNLNFATDENSLRKHFSKCGRILSVTIAQKADPKHRGKKVSVGYGFIQFSSKREADNALKTLQFSKLDDHALELKRSNRVTKPEQNTFRNFAANHGKPNLKILVKNVPFQATEKEVRSLFKVFGEIKSVRLPKKMVGTGSHRGFCFVEFHTIHDAKRAFKALSQSTHLYGRRLVLEWASEDDDVDAMRKKTAERFKTDKKAKKAISMEEDAVAAADSE